jgi:heme exporter protein CcmB
LTGFAALLRKEFLDEFRSKSGILTSLLFSFVIIVALGQASAGRELSGTAAAGFIWVGLLFSASLALPRTMIQEEERGTGDLLRIWTNPLTVFWAKAAFNAVQMTAIGLLMTAFYVATSNLVVTSPLALTAGVVFGCLALSGTVTLSGALVAQASQRTILAGGIALPLLIPLVYLGITAVRWPLGEGTAESGSTGIIGLFLYAVAGHAIGPLVFEAIWKS